MYVTYEINQPCWFTTLDTFGWTRDYTIFLLVSAGKAEVLNTFKRDVVTEILCM
jgi:hypothetical protein